MKNLFSMSIDEFLPIYEKAIELGKSRGKKVGDRLDEEFFEVLKKHNKKVKHLGTTEKDIDLLTGDLREEGVKVINLNEEMKKKHYHIIGRYWHDSSTLLNYRKGSERDGLGDTYLYYKFCPDCGKKITKEIIRRQEAK